MYISLNIILDGIRHYKHERLGDFPEDVAFDRCSFLSPNINELRKETLYICRFSAQTKALILKEELYCICLCNTNDTKPSMGEGFSKTIVVEEEVELAQFFAEVQEIFVNVTTWYENMLHALITKKSMQDILSMCEHVIGNFISISDSALALLAYTKRIQTDDPVSIFLVNNGYHSVDTVKKFKRFKRYDAWKNTDRLIINTSNDIAKYTIVSKVFTFDETYYMHMVMSCNHKELTQGLLDLFSLLSRVLDYHVKNEWEESKLPNTAYTSLFSDLMSGINNGKVDERAMLVGIKPEDDYIVMLVTEGNRGNSTFPGHMAQDITQMFSFAKPIYYNFRLVLFFHHSNLEDRIEEVRLYSKLNTYFEENNVQCGVSEVFDNLLEMSEAYKQAELALGEIMAQDSNASTIFRYTQKRSHIAQFSSYYAMCLLSKDERIESLWRYSKYGKMLFFLHEYDLSRQTNCLEILCNYLFNERRATETANSIHMHRNTVVYHITRIEQLLKIKLDCKLTRLNLIISFLMLERYGIQYTGEKAMAEEPQIE
ncbi:MAG: helix-turn-helix domain-containing protein [Oscillospiraceae bacterium]|nr:helix-turn-helix domain-containing protein [Oscillospiraceae bacterium]